MDEQLATVARQCGLGGWLASRGRLSTFEPRTAWPGGQQIWEECVLYAGEITQGGSIPAERNWLVLCGNFGTGKSHLAAGIVMDVAMMGLSARFVPWVEYLDAIRDSFGSNGRRWRGDEVTQTAQLMRELMTPWLLALDDLDKEPPSDWTQKVLYKVLNRRYNECLPTVITLNYNLDSNEIAAIMPPAILDRVLERMWKVLIFDGPSFRSGLVLTA